MNLVHIIPNLGPGGPGRSLTTFVEWSSRNTPGASHLVLTLQPRIYPLLSVRLRRCGAVILQNLNAAQIDETLSGADVVLLHFWNTPLVWRLIARMPPVRSVLWVLVRGDRVPQRLNANLLHSASRVVLAAEAPAHILPDFEQAPIVPGLIQPERVANIVRRPHEGFRIDYVGTTNSGKLDAKFFSIMGNLKIRDVRVRIYGGALEPAMAQAHAAMSDPSRVEIGGFTENVAEVFSTTDVYAFPMAENSYSAGDLALQEAMLAGLPVVIYADRGSSRLVKNEKTGLVVSDAAEFTAAIERLYHDPALRRTLGTTAQTYAAAEFGSDKYVTSLASVVENAAASPKQPLVAQRTTSIGLAQLPPAALFWFPRDGLKRTLLTRSLGGPRVATTG
jgi:glycosyltransferase involved in cell wall biosynthesis